MSVASPMESSTPIVSRRPTPYTVAISPYRTVSGRILSIASGADTRISSVAGAAPPPQVVAATRPRVVAALVATTIPGGALIRARGGVATEQPEAPVGTGAGGPP